MCRSTQLNYKVQAPFDATAIGLQNSQAVSNLTSSLSSALENVKSHNGGSNSSRKQRHHHIIVEHDYHDHANELELIDERPARGGVTTPFPIRLHKMLDQMQEDGHADVISWQPHGRAFVVHKPKEFKELLPTYFKLSKMSSFQRQLNLYGFQRLTRGRDKNGYYHEYFLRGKPALSHKIQRTKVKGTGVRARSNPATEPHLWEMSWVGMESSSAAQHQYGNCDNGSVSSHEEHFESPKQSPMPPLKQESNYAVNNASAFSLPPLSGSYSMASAAVESSTPFMVPSWTQQQPLVQQQPSQHALYAARLRNEQDVVMSFGGKQFHYLDPKEMTKEAEMRKKQVAACKQVDTPPKRDDLQAFMSNLELDSLYAEIDDDHMENDDAFMDMLERVIE
ncbi:Heat stress transcription factor [Seminavis robusta]|uniref:Heat stress transcription factor n=1 Tax=Seminavis robusta TaxID=568900 RepID=A0A9N8EY25_9STRA|nr:Heat stress transcription factor [Seminavis robusta]|eukprot:Sro1900_g304260.1 Heat stress transcription factor (393) ;mRNA; f:12510-13776